MTIINLRWFYYMLHTLKSIIFIYFKDYDFHIFWRVRRVVHLKAFGINACGKGSQNNCKYGNKEALLRGEETFIVWDYVCILIHMEYCVWTCCGGKIDWKTYKYSYPTTISFFLVICLTSYGGRFTEIPWWFEVDSESN